jgi:hypothetical protein
MGACLPSGGFIPHLLSVCEGTKVSQWGIEGAPDLVVAIPSPRTPSKDPRRKRWAQEAVGP